MNRSQAIEYRRKIEKAASFQDDETALKSIELYPQWKPDIDVVVGERYQDDNVLYRCIQSHKTQSDWKPSLTPALWVVVSLDEWPEWVQPTGAQDAYMIGDKVTYNGRHYVSIIDYNVYSPDVYPQGWEAQP